jgi:putative ABC transport system permease protein
MSILRRLLLLLPWRRRAAERDMREELLSIVAMAEDPRELGSLSRAAEDARAQWEWTRLRQVGNDLGYAWKSFRSHRGTTALAFGILTLTLAVGTVTFSVVDAIVLRPLPYTDRDDLVSVARQVRPSDGPGPVSPQQFFAWRDRVQTFDMIGAVVSSGVTRIASDGSSGDLRIGRVTTNLFDVLRVQAVLGRAFLPGDDTPGRDQVVVLTHDVWVRRFAADAGVIGRRIALVDRAAAETMVEVVGVLPPGVVYPASAIQPIDLFRPYVPTERDWMYPLPQAYFVDVIGRLKPRVSLEQARADIERATAAVRSEFGMTGAPIGTAVVMRLHDRIVGKARGWLLLILAGVGCVVLVGCVNASSLLLSRAVSRAREFSTRAALGASRTRLVRTLLAEGFILVFAASATATLFSHWGLGLVKASLPSGLARASTIAIDGRVLVASIAVAVLCGVIAGGASGWRIGRMDLFDHLRSGAAVVGGYRQFRAFGAFLIAEMAFVSALLVATTLLVTSFVAVVTADLGFDRRNVVAIWIQTPVARAVQGDGDRIWTSFFDDVLRRARAVPGVAAVGLIGLGGAPLGGGATRYSLEIPGRGTTPPEDFLETRAVSPEYFSTIGLRVREGRAFTASDVDGAPSVAIINEWAAQRLFAGLKAVGTVVRFNDRPTRIVGIVQDPKIHGPEAASISQLYLPLAQSPMVGILAADPASSFVAAQLVIRATADPYATASAVRQALYPVFGAEKVTVRGMTLDSISAPRSLDDSFWEITEARRFNASLMGAFGLVALVIGAIGVYGTMAFIVAQQTRSIGLRIALGATPSDVIRSVVSAAVWRAGVGIGTGLLIAWASAGLFTSLVFGVEPTDMRPYLVVVAILGSVAFLAALVPARRAARIDPILSLRAE